MRGNGSDVDPSIALRLDAAVSARADAIPDYRDSYTHYLVVGSALDATMGVGAGLAHLPGRTLVMRSQLDLISPDMFAYQAKTFMHELGHNLGLCHPSESTAACPSGAIPVAERGAGATVMGSPIEANDIFSRMEQALSRPLDYSSTQWINLGLDLSATGP